MTEFSNNLMQMFQKGSPLARDVSKAILHLSEKAELKRLEEKWLITSPASCSNVTSDDTDSLKLRSLWILYVISGATSTICVLLSAIQSLVKSCHQCQAVAPEGNDTPSDHKVWEKVITHAKHIFNKKINNSSEAQEQVVTDCSLRWDRVNMTVSPEHQQEMASPLPGILMLPSPPPEVQTTTHDLGITNTSK